ncbi:hypothetical protein NPIL_385341 [Nephila pilipes]|uniref:Uncharacterized protein n=1 Tax=Nephila pilipes TaxID=299642 RepID=A0A8X6PQI2_NEPPI|nr:hypothetical protein NPIL_385341 [Nephila pilipes]
MAVSFCQGARRDSETLTTSVVIPLKNSPWSWEKLKPTRTPSIRGETSPQDLFKSEIEYDGAEWTALSDPRTHGDRVCPSRLNTDGAGGTGVWSRNQGNSALRHASPLKSSQDERMGHRAKRVF